MRRRNIKSVAHWVIMSVVLLFPILMVGISSFAQPQQEINVTETYEYQTNEVNSVDDLIVGNIYKFTYDDSNMSTSLNFMPLYGLYYFDNEQAVEYAGIKSNSVATLRRDLSSNYYAIRYNNNSIILIPYTEHIFECYVVYGGLYDNGLVTYQNFSLSDYLGEHTIDYTITDETMREDVNQWCASFRNLPVNVWYGNLLSAIGLGITTSMMMNVIYTYPLYVLWVYILDLVVDIFLVIINFGHNALRRLGGDNE